MLRSLNSRRGFTLIEILVVVSTVIMLSAITITHSRVSERQIALYIETQKLANVIFRAKALALATYSDPSASRCGYGVGIDYTEKRYSLFSHSAPNCSSLTSIPASSRTAITTYAMSSGLVFKNSAPDSLSVVLFVPPNPKTLLSVDGGATLTAQPAKMYLETGDGRAQRTITINNFGQVDF